MNQSDDFSFILAAKKRYPQLCHASNIIKKHNGALNAQQECALNMLITAYAAYLRNMLATTSYDQKAIFDKVHYLNEYYNFMHSNQLDLAFSSQGKFRPTILEEFLFLLFKDYLTDIKLSEDNNDTLHSGSAKAYSNLYFKAKNFKDFIKSPMIEVNTKDQAYAIYRTFKISADNGKTLDIQIPAVAIEAKTYIDKTMLDTIIATAEKIKSGNPHARFIAVAERYDVSYSVDPAYSRIDQIYVLRKSMRKNEWIDIDKDVVWRLFSETLWHLSRPWSDVETRIKDDGVII